MPTASSQHRCRTPTRACLAATPLRAVYGLGRQWQALCWRPCRCKEAAAEVFFLGRIRQCCVAQEGEQLLNKWSPKCWASFPNREIPAPTIEVRMNHESLPRDVISAYAHGERALRQVKDCWHNYISLTWRGACNNIRCTIGSWDVSRLLELHNLSTQLLKWCVQGWKMVLMTNIPKQTVAKNKAHEWKMFLGLGHCVQAATSSSVAD